MKTEIVDIEKTGDVNVILGQAHFIKTVEDIYESLISSSPNIKFGVAFCEASGDRLIRKDGNDSEMTDLAVKNASKIGSGHSFIIFLKDAYPINVLNAVKSVHEVCCIYAATANALRVIVAADGESRGIMGVLDGEKPLGVEDEKKTQERKSFLRKIGYKR